MGALALGDFKPRKLLFEPMLAKNVSHVSACHPYRDLRDGEDVKGYVERLAQELEDEFQRLGPETVCAFMVEPMVGTVSLVKDSAAGFGLTFMKSGTWLRGTITRVSKSDERGLPTA